MKLQEVGRANNDHAHWLRQLLEEFRRRRLLPLKQELENQLHAVSDHAQALELLRRLQNHAATTDPGSTTDGSARP
jgi:sugar phosphate isomerase/epimerase